jgi:hypothetical protein
MDATPKTADVDVIANVKPREICHLDMELS